MPFIKSILFSEPSCPEGTGEVSSTRENIETNSEDVPGRDISETNFDHGYFGVDSLYPGITVNKASYDYTIYILK